MNKDAKFFKILYGLVVVLIILICLSPFWSDSTHSHISPNQRSAGVAETERLSQVRFSGTLQPIFCEIYHKQISRCLGGAREGEMTTRDADNWKSMELNDVAELRGDVLKLGSNEVRFMCTAKGNIGDALGLDFELALPTESDVWLMAGDIYTLNIDSLPLSHDLRSAGDSSKVMLVNFKDDWYLVYLVYRRIDYDTKVARGFEWATTKYEVTRAVWKGDVSILE